MLSKYLAPNRMAPALSRLQKCKDFFWSIVAYAPFLRPRIRILISLPPAPVLGLVPWYLRRPGYGQAVRISMQSPHFTRAVQFFHACEIILAMHVCNDTPILQTILQGTSSFEVPCNVVFLRYLLQNEQLHECKADHSDAGD